MKRVMLWAITLVVLVSAVNLWAGEQPGAAAANPGANALTSSGAPGGGAAWYIQYVDKIVALTDAQKKAMNEIIEARDRGMRDFQTQNAEKIKAAGKAVTETYKSGDKDAVAKAQKAYQDLYAPMHEMMRKSQADLANVLTPRQKAGLHDYQVMTAAKNITAPVQLSDEQIERLKALCREEELTGFGGNVYQAVQQILTPEQKAAIAGHRGMNYVKAMVNPVELTADQLQQIEAACDELAEEFPLGTGKFYARLGEKVNGVVTNEQKAAIAKGRAMSYVKAAFRHANLTADQLKAVEVVCEESAEGLAIPINSGALYKQITAKVNELLSDEQKTAMKAARPSWGQAGGAPGSAMPGASGSAMPGAPVGNAK